MRRYAQELTQQAQQDIASLTAMNKPAGGTDKTKDW